MQVKQKAEWRARLHSIDAHAAQQLLATAHTALERDAAQRSQARDAADAVRHAQRLQAYQRTQAHLRSLQV